MKNMFKYIVIIVAVIFSTAACSDYLDVNTDPNNPTAVTPDLVLPVAQHYTAQLHHGARRFNDLSNLLMYNWSQSDGFSWYTDEFKYNVTTSFYQGIFNDSYTRCLKQYQVLANLEEAKYVNYKAIAEIMKAYHFQLLVDAYGDVPYTEALQRSGNSTPKYDDAATIYKDLIVKLTAAIEMIKKAEATAVVPGADDGMFGGDMTNWIKFANSVKLRILVRQSGLASEAAYLKTQFDAIVAEGSGFYMADVAINPGYINGEVDKQNPLWDNLGKDAAGSETANNKATCATDYVLTYLTNTNDARLARLYETTAGVLGVPQGLADYDTPVPDAFVPEKVCNIGPGILKSGDQGSIIYTAAECYLNQAEAVVRNMLAGDAQVLYEAGVTASFTQLGLTSALATNYLAGTYANVGWAQSANKIQAIITQKWIATNGTTAEQAWFDYSRTGFPAGLPISMQATSADRPVRLFYPSGEISANTANVPTQPNAFSAKIFWAQ